jgi:hypothetical protein
LYITDHWRNQSNVIFKVGKVGIGISTPTAKLDVNGDLKVRGEIQPAADKGLK